MVDHIQKFIVGPKLANHSGMGNWILLADYRHWGEETLLVELDDWCEKYLVNGKESRQGATIQFANEQELAFFILRWS
jgi:hypothetical protein